MVDGNLVFVDNLENFSASQLVISNTVYVFRTAVKFGETSIKFLSYKSSTFSGHIKVSYLGINLKYSELTILISQLYLNVL